MQQPGRSTRTAIGRPHTSQAQLLAMVRPGKGPPKRAGNTERHLQLGALCETTHNKMIRHFLGLVLHPMQTRIIEHSLYLLLKHAICMKCCCLSRATSIHARVTDWYNVSQYLMLNFAEFCKLPCGNCMCRACLSQIQCWTKHIPATAQLERPA